MHSITLQDYTRGREVSYPKEWAPGLEANALATVRKVNVLLTALAAAGVPLETSPLTHSLVNSGWRPPQINSITQGAAVKSLHMTCEACDIYDPDGAIDHWCVNNLDKLEAFGLWLEHPASTKGWCHVQTRGPASGRRVFYP